MDQSLGGSFGSDHWEGERLSSAAVAGATGEELEHLSESQWWLGRIEDALEARTQAYRAYKKESRTFDAVRAAAWLAREFHISLGNESAASGWLARAETTVGDDTDRIWLLLEQARRSDDPMQAADLAKKALSLSKNSGDVDGELLALAALGLARVASGFVEEGKLLLDEAMAAATGGEARNPSTLGEVLCATVAASGIAPDPARIQEWSAVMRSYLARHSYPPLICFCGACCFELMASTGDLTSAERELLSSIENLEKMGHQSRCSDPRIKLAELRIIQGRLEDAEALLSGLIDRPEAVMPRVILEIERNNLSSAAAFLQRRLSRVGPDNLVSVPMLIELANIMVRSDDLPRAEEYIGYLEKLARRTGLARVEAARDLSKARIAVVRKDQSARELFESAIRGFSSVGLVLDAALARLELADLLGDTDPHLALEEAQAAAATLEKVGARRWGDKAAQVVRNLGGPSRTGRKDGSVLTNREREVLRLIGYGYTNAQIAERLFISTKTAGHHVSSVLSKLGMKGRAEAAAYAATLPPEE